MKISVRFLCIDVYAGKNEFEFELADRAVLDDALAACLTLDHVKLTLKELRDSVFLKGIDRAGLDDPLKDGDCITILRPLAGG